MTDVLELSRALMRCPSVTPHEAGTLAILEAALTPLGFKCRRVTFEGHDSAPVENMVATYGDSGPHFAFAGHVDVVPVGDAAAWLRDPFGAQVEDGVLYGRGAVDMKTGIAAFVVAAERLIAAGPVRGRISLLITCDEEGPSVNGTEPLLKMLHDEGVRFDACVVGEPSGYDRFGDMAKIGRRGSLHGDIIVRGKQGHVAYPDRADNPIPHLLRLLTALETYVIDEGTADFQPSNLEIVTVDVGNPARNVIPANATARFNVRFNDLHSSASLAERLRKVCDSVGVSYEITFRTGAEPFLTQPGPLSAALVKAVQEITGSIPRLSTTGGTSDARFVAKYCPVLEFGLLGRSLHEVNEHVAVEQLELLAQTYQRLLENWFASHD